MTILLALLFWIGVFFVFYVYLGYPIIAYGMSRLFPPEREYTEAGLPSVTLLIAAYNEEKVIADKLENTLKLDYPSEKLQIIVAADGSDDATVSIVNGYAARRVELSFDSARRGKMSAINRAMQLARNHIVVFSDANNHYATDTLKQIVKPYEDKTVGAVSGSKQVLKEGTKLGQADGLYWRYESFIKRTENRIGCCVGVSGEVFSIRRELFQPPPVSIINDDFYMALDIIKRGYRVVYAPAAHSIEMMTLSEKDEVTRRTRMFAGQIQILFEAFRKLPFRQPHLVWMIVSHKYLRAFVPLGMMAAYIANLLAAIFQPAVTGVWGWLLLSPPIGIYFLMLQCVFYLLGFVGSRVKFGGFMGRLLYLPAFLLNSNYAAWLGIVRYFSGAQTVMWKKAAR
jgi:cellulose synthase/poly-beta-1,6-N-acetylglucosamine synthase-like glycosyltransferase